MTGVQTCALPILVFHALEKEREKRFRTAGEVKTSVEAITSNPAPAQASLPCPSPGAAIPERRMPCYISTPEHLHTFIGHFIDRNTGKGELRLDAENLTFVSNWQSTVIPLRDIRELGIGHFSRLAKPVRLDYLAVTFEQAAQRRTLLFTPTIWGGIVFPWVVNPLVANCLRAVHEAVIARTGKAPGGASPAELPDSYAQEALWRNLKIVLPMSAVATAVTLFMLALMRSTGPRKTWEETRGGWLMLLVSAAVLLFIIAMSVRDARAARNRAHDRGSFGSEPPLGPPPGSGPRPRYWLFKSSFPFLVAVGLVALALLRWGAGGWHLPASGERVRGIPSAPESEGQFVLYTMPPPGAYRPGLLHWTFKCLVPANHFARIVMVRWTNGVPEAQPGGSAYFKVGKTPMVEDFQLSCERYAGVSPTGATNIVQWNASLVAQVTAAVPLPGEPAYRPLEPPARLTVRSGHQGVLRLVEYVTPEGESSHGPSGMELRIFLEPLKSPPIRTDPFEVEGTNYVAGRCRLGWTMEEALKAIKEWPTDQ